MALAAPTLAGLAAAAGAAAWAAGGLGGPALVLVGIEARMHDRQFRHIHPKLGADATDKGHSTCVAKLAVPLRLREFAPVGIAADSAVGHAMLHSLSHGPR